MVLDILKPFVETHGYWLIFIIIMCESAGLPVPGETALISVAIYAGASGQLDIILIFLIAAGAAVVGDNIGFAIGRYWGRPLLLRHGSLIRLTPARMEQGQRFFDLYGAKVIFFGRFVALLRIYAALLAGVNGYDWSQFLLYNALGACAWAALFSFGGYAFGDVLIHYAGPLSILLFLCAIIGVAAVRFFAHRSMRTDDEI
jgi:membrane protein DedA with SNARE-associated domain